MDGIMHFDVMTRSLPGEFRFLKLPKAFFMDPDLTGLSLHAKVLYGLLLDRSCISRENGWFDESGYLFIIYSIKDAMEDLQVSKPTAIAAFNELNDKSGAGLIHIRNQKKGRPNIIYVKDITSKWIEPVKNPNLECQTEGHPGQDALPEQVKTFDTNETKENKTNGIETDINDDVTFQENKRTIDEKKIRENLSSIYNQAVNGASKEIAEKALYLMLSKMKSFHNKEDIRIINGFSARTLIELFIEAYDLVTGYREANDVQGYMYSVIEGNIAERR